MLVIIGIVGSIASIVSLFLSKYGWRTRIIHAIYVFAMIILASIIVHKQSESRKFQDELKRIHSIERAANNILGDQRQMTAEGFINASLAFLEKNQNYFPDRYKKAQEICNVNEVFITNEKIEESGGSSLRHGYSKIEVSYALSGILEGIAAVSSDD